MFMTEEEELKTLYKNLKEKVDAGEITPDEAEDTYGQRVWGYTEEDLKRWIHG